MWPRILKKSLLKFMNNTFFAFVFHFAYTCTRTELATSNKFTCNAKKENLEKILTL